MELFLTNGHRIVTNASAFRLHVFFFSLFFVYGTEDVPPFFTSISIDGSTESIRGKTAIYCISVALYGYLMRPDFGRRTLKMVISRLDEFQIRFKTSFGGITFSFFFSVVKKALRLLFHQTVDFILLPRSSCFRMYFLIYLSFFLK